MCVCKRVCKRARERATARRSGISLLDRCLAAAATSSFSSSSLARPDDSACTTTGCYRNLASTLLSSKASVSATSSGPSTSCIRTAGAMRTSLRATSRYPRQPSARAYLRHRHSSSHSMRRVNAHTRTHTQDRSDSSWPMTRSYDAAFVPVYVPTHALAKAHCNDVTLMKMILMLLASLQ